MGKNIKMKIDEYPVIREHKWISKEEAKEIFSDKLPKDSIGFKFGNTFLIDNYKGKQMLISDFYFKKLGKMINDEDYDLNERFAPRLLDWGFIKEVKYGAYTMGYRLSCSCYKVTNLGKEAYNQWIKGKDVS